MTTTGFELILPFLQPIQHLILDPEISEIMVNGADSVFIERAGRVEGVQGLTLSPKSLEVAVTNIARPVLGGMWQGGDSCRSWLPDSGDRGAPSSGGHLVNSTSSRSTVGLRLSQGALRVLRERGIFSQSSVSLEHRHFAKCYVVRGLESGGAAGDVGHYVTFAREDGRPAECFRPVETIGVNGPHAVVLAPVLVRIEMLGKASTYELLITQHRPSQFSNGTRPLLEAKILFRGVHGRLELDLSGKDKARAGTVLPAFCSRSGEEVGIPRRFRSAIRAVTAAVHCTGCSHSHYTKLPTKGEEQNTPAESANTLKAAGAD